MKDKILIFGNGQLGNFYSRFFTSKKIKNRITKVDITRAKAIARVISEFAPTVVINSAAKTNLEWCAQNRLEAFNVNVLGPDNIATECDKKNIYFVHLSSGCIMESKNASDAKDEQATPYPISYYSWTKVWAENLILFKKSKKFKYLILRPRQPVSSEVNHKNMLVKLLTFTKFVDTPNSGTVVEDLMDWTEKLINVRYCGVINVANEGWTTPYQIGLLLKKHILPGLPVKKISKKMLNELTPEKRVDTILDVDRLKKTVGVVKPYEKRLEEIILTLRENFKAGNPKKINQQLEKTVVQSKMRTVVNDKWKELLR